MSSGFGFLGLCRVALHFRDVVAVGQAESFTVTRTYPQPFHQTLLGGKVVVHQDVTTSVSTRIEMQLLVRSLMYCDGPTLEAVLVSLPPFPPTPPSASKLISLFSAREPVICSLYMPDGSVVSMTEPGYVSVFILENDYALSVDIIGEDVEFR